MKKLLLLASAAVFIYAAFTQFRTGDKEPEQVPEIITPSPESSDLPLSMYVNGDAYASYLADTVSTAPKIF